MKPITVLLAEDHTIVREGFRKMLELEAGIKVVGEAADGRQAVALARKLEPAVVLMDIAMPRLNGLEATRQLLKAWPAVRVLILSAHSDAAYVQNAVAAGAAGFLLKQDSAHEVCRAIRTVQKGKTFFSPAVARQLARLLPRASGSGGPQKKSTSLTSREIEVLQLIAEGRRIKEIAADLGISAKTAEKHRGHVMDKLDIHDSAGLARYAISTGIIENSVPLTIT